MPFAALSLLLMPFGLEGWALAGDGLGLRCAAVGGALGRRIGRAPSPFCRRCRPLPCRCWRSACCGWAWRAAAGAGSARRRSPSRSPPRGSCRGRTSSISPSGKLVAFRTPDGDLILSSNRAERLVRETWLRRNGQIRFDDIGDLRRLGILAALHARRHCDYAGAQSALFCRAPKPADCGGPELTIVAARRRQWIDCPRHVDQPGDLAARGAHAIYLNDGDGIEIVDAASAIIGKRPWALPIPGGSTTLGRISSAASSRRGGPGCARGRGRRCASCAPGWRARARSNRPCGAAASR